jgi:hypothetical protein
MRPFVKTALVILALPLLTAADIYRWVDDNGVVNYTQQKPRHVDAELVSSKHGSAEAPPAARPKPETPAQPELDEKQQRLLQELQAAEATRRQEVAEARADNCLRARNLLERLTTKSRIKVRGDDGQVKVLPEEERQQRIAEAQQGIAVNCERADA